MKKLLGVILIIVIALFGLTACTDGNAETNGSGTDNGEISAPSETEQQEIDKMYITINGNKLEVALDENPSTAALAEKLKQGNITYTAKGYGGFEMVGGLGFSLPTDDTEIITQAGDVMLYTGNQIVLFYSSHKWAYTRLGKINGYSASELKELLGAGKENVQVTLSLK